MLALVLARSWLMADALQAVALVLARSWLMADVSRLRPGSLVLSVVYARCFQVVALARSFLAYG